MHSIFSEIDRKIMVDIIILQAFLTSGSFLLKQRADADFNQPAAVGFRKDKARPAA